MTSPIRSNERIEANVIIRNGHNIPDEESMLFLADDAITYFDDPVSFAEVLTAAGIFQSRGDAKKAGWTQPLPLGFSEHVIGKRKNMLYLWNPMPYTEGANEENNNGT